MQYLLITKWKVSERPNASILMRGPADRKRTLREDQQWSRPKRKTEPNNGITPKEILWNTIQQRKKTKAAYQTPLTKPMTPHEKGITQSPKKLTIKIMEQMQTKWMDRYYQ